MCIYLSKYTWYRSWIITLSPNNSSQANPNSLRGARQRRSCRSNNMLKVSSPGVISKIKNGGCCPGSDTYSWWKKSVKKTSWYYRELSILAGISHIFDIFGAGCLPSKVGIIFWAYDGVQSHPQHGDWPQPWWSLQWSLWGQYWYLRLAHGSQSGMTGYEI